MIPTPIILYDTRLLKLGEYGYDISKVCFFDLAVGQECEWGNSRKILTYLETNMSLQKSLPYDFDYYGISFGIFGENENISKFYLSKDIEKLKRSVIAYFWVKENRLLHQLPLLNKNEYIWGSENKVEIDAETAFYVELVFHKPVTISNNLMLRVELMGNKYI